MRQPQRRSRTPYGDRSRSPCVLGLSMSLTPTCLLALISGMESKEGTPTFGFAGLSSATPRAGRTDPRRRPSRSQPTRSWATGMGRAISDRCSVIMAADPDHLTVIEQVGMEADSRPKASGCNRTWVAIGGGKLAGGEAQVQIRRAPGGFQ